MKFVLSNNDVIDVELYCLPAVFNQQAAVLTIVRDITERNHTHEILQQLEKLAMIGELAAGVAHEIRNPLTSLRGFVQLFQYKDSDPQHQEYYSVMLSELDRINSIVGELLLLAKPQKNNMNLKDPLAIVESVLALLGPEALLHNVEIRTEFESDIPLVMCEENKLKQVFLNVMKNAMEAMSNGGEIIVEARKIGANVVLRFIDQGCGVPKENLDRIGQVFFTTKEKGTGLGLVVSSSIIKNHNGSLSIKSEENKGTTVEIVIPAFLDSE